jgi:hypothetical protein
MFKLHQPIHMADTARRWVDDKGTARKLKAADFGVFAAVWGKSASFDVLCTAAKYFAWVCSSQE